MKKDEKISLEQKLQLSYKNIALLNLGVLLLSIIMLITTNFQYKKAINNYGNSQGVIAKLGMQFNEQRMLLRDVLIYTDGTDKTAINNKLNSNIQNSSEQLQKVGKTIVNDEERKIYSELSNNVVEYRKIRENVINYLYAGNIEDAMNVLNGEGAVIGEKVYKNINDLLEANINGSSRIIKILTIFEIISVLILASSVIFFKKLAQGLSQNNSKMILEPINIVKDASENLSKGNLQVSIEVESDDEIGQLINNFKVMAHNFKQYIDEIGVVFGNIAGGNLDVSTSDIYQGDFLMIKEVADNILWALNDTFKNIKDAAEQVSGGSTQVSKAAQSLSE